MILQLNRVLPHNIYNRTNFRYISSTKYPEQDERYLGKYIRIRYTNHNNSPDYQSRLIINKNIHPEFTCTGADIDTKFKIVRFDKVEPNVVILINSRNEVIVADNNIINEYLYYPGYIREEDEVELQVADSWEIFNNKYFMEKIYCINVSEVNLLGRVVFTEYLEDLEKYDSFTNVAKPELNNGKTFEQIKAQLIMGNPKLEVMPDCILKSFPAYYNRHEHDLVDIPMRTINTGVVIRADINGDHFVIMEILEDGTKRFVTESEGFYYYETESQPVNLYKENILEI